MEVDIPLLTCREISVCSQEARSPSYYSFQASLVSDGVQF